MLSMVLLILGTCQRVSKPLQCEIFDRTHAQHRWDAVAQQWCTRLSVSIINIRVQVHNCHFKTWSVSFSPLCPFLSDKPECSLSVFTRQFILSVLYLSLLNNWVKFYAYRASLSGHICMQGWHIFATMW